MKKVITILAFIIPVLTQAQLRDSSQRVVRMQGTVNFRDAGGYLTKDGRQVVWGKVYRSADISKLTSQDLQTLSGKRIYTVIDFRGIKESAAAPDRLLPHTDYTLSPAGSDSLPDLRQMAARVKQGGFLEKMYGTETIQYWGQRYRPLFQKLLTLPDTAALLFHCTGGRDRTGMAAALFLYALGVPQPTIEEDFTASNVYLQSMNEKMFRPMAQGMGMSVEEIRKAFELRPELIRSFFKTITEKYGSVEMFMDKELGVGKNELSVLRKKYTM